MSYSSEIKKELTLVSPGEKCCQLAQISGFLRFAGSITLQSGGMGIRIQTDSPAVARDYAARIKDYFGSRTELTVEESVSLSKRRSYGLYISPEMNADAILRETGMLGIREGSNYVTDGLDPIIVRKKCCKKAALRGAFMAAGSVSGLSAKGYHMQISCRSLRIAEDIRKIMLPFGLLPGISQHGDHYQVYLKDGEQIADFLSVIGATNQMFRLRDVIINRQLKNTVNRINNCENANMDKIVGAAQKQINDIRLIQETKGLEYLQPKLRETAELRLENPELSLSELCTMFDPPLKKSGLNHRFEKIADIAERIKTDGAPD